MRTFQASRKHQVSFNRLEDRVLMAMAAREGVGTAEMIRECVRREAVRPLLGAKPLLAAQAEVQDGQDSDVRTPA